MVSNEVERIKILEQSKSLAIQVNEFESEKNRFMYFKTHHQEEITKHHELM
jgi:hypothetical protein